MKKIILENWRNSFNTTSKITKLEFWSFLIVNYFLIVVLSFIIGGYMELSDSKEKALNYFYAFLVILLLFPICTAAIRRINDVNTSKLLLLIPFYNIFLLLKKGNKQNEVRIGDASQIRMLIRITFGTILIGAMNLIIEFILLIIVGDNAGTNEVFGVIIFALRSIPIALLSVFLLLLLNKKQTSKETINTTLIQSFLIILPFILIISYAAIQ